MNQPTVESLFGFNAGIVWKTLNQNGPSNLANLVKSTSLSREEIIGALGWLGREDKIAVEQKGRAMVFSLRDEEARLTIPEDTTAEEPTPRSKSKRRKTKPPEKSKMASKVRVPVKQPDRMEEFLLH
jgi:hypothetical protein